MMEGTMALSAVSKTYLIKQPHNALGDLVWSYAEGKLEEHEEIASSGETPQSVGNGECTDFVSAALEFAGARPGDFSKENYEWGDVVFHWHESLPSPQLEFGKWQHGDIIQFWDASFAWPGTTWGVAAPKSTDPAKRRHTSIILKPPGMYACDSSWSTLLVHQNDGVRYVTKRTVWLHSLKQGEFTIYRPSK
jgi:hypothetical protein